MAEKFKRRNYFIDKNFQTRFMMKFGSIIVLSSLLILGGILFFSSDSNTVAIENTKVTVKRTSDFILPIVAINLTVVVFFSGLGVLALTMLVSHQIAGPLFRLRREVDLLQRADFRRDFHIRGNDQLQAFAKSLDAMCRSLKDKHLGLKASFNSLSKFIRDRNFHIAAKDADQLLTLLDHLQVELDNFKT
ncbi:MAG: hypothetical protein K9L86_07170 [Candidatus Omnitrophica bacterium]|nr:hypothetical protein [Candidatus Omnitrophota bacterium]